MRPFCGKAVIETGEMVQKIKAAVDQRIDGDLVIVARTDARAVFGLDAAIEARAGLHRGRGRCDFRRSAARPRRAERIAGALPAPQIANMVFGGQTPPVGQRDLATMGFAGVLYANAALQAAVHGMREVLGELRRSGSLDAVRDKVASFEVRQRLVDKGTYDGLEQRYTSQSPTG